MRLLACVATAGLGSLLIANAMTMWWSGSQPAYMTAEDMRNLATWTMAIGSLFIGGALYAVLKSTE